VWPVDPFIIVMLSTLSLSSQALFCEIFVVHIVRGFFNQREIFPWKIFGMSEKYHYGRQFKGESGPVNLVPTADLNCIFHLYYYAL